MKVSPAFVILLLVISEGNALRTFTINLDLPPKERFREANKFFKQGLIDFVGHFEGFLFDAAMFIIDKLSLGENIKDWTLEEKEEIEGLGEIMGIYPQFWYFVQLIGDFWSPLRNFFGYEKPYVPGCHNKSEGYPWPFDWCTAVIVNQPSGIIHARNFDNMAEFAGLLYRGKFTQGGNLLFEADMMAGHFGVITAMKDGAFGVTVDTRSPYVKWRYDILPLLEMLVRMQKSGYRTQTMLVRETLTKAKSYVDALDMLSNTNLVSDVYYTVSGVKRGEGAILSRDPLGCAHISYLGEERFIIVTNYDYWNNDHRADSDPRRADAIKQLDAIPGQLTGHELFKVLSSDEVMQGYCTLETTIIDAQIGEFDSTFWWDD